VEVIEVWGAELSRLLEQVLEAHGGLRQWQRLSDLVTGVQMEGHLCPRGSASTSIPESQGFFSLRQQNIVLVIDGGSQTISIEPDLVTSIENRGPRLKTLSIHELPSGVVSFDDRSELLRTAYVLGFAIRHYVTAPFLYLSPGFNTEEVASWNGDGEAWRVLKISFPSNIEARTRVQYAYYGQDGLLRRTRYKLDGSDSMECVNYVSSYDQVNGIWLPVSREISVCDSEGVRLPNQVLAKIRLLNPFFTE
jgi:hypothetical protein